MGEAIHLDGGAFDGTILLAAAFDDCKSHFIFSSYSLRRASRGGLALCAGLWGSWVFYSNCPGFELRGRSGRYYTCGTALLSTGELPTKWGNQTQSPALKRQTYLGSIAVRVLVMDCNWPACPLILFTSPVRRPACTSVMVLVVVFSLSMIFCVMPSRFVSNCITFLGTSGRFFRIGSNASRMLLAVRAYFTVSV